MCAGINVQADARSCVLQNQPRLFPSWCVQLGSHSHHSDLQRQSSSCMWNPKAWHPLVHEECMAQSVTGMQLHGAPSHAVTSVPPGS